MKASTKTSTGKWRWVKWIFIVPNPGLLSGGAAVFLPADLVVGRPQSDHDQLHARAASGAAGEKSEREYPAGVGAVQPHLEQPEARHHRFRRRQFLRARGRRLGCAAKGLRAQQQEAKGGVGGSTITQQLAKNLFLSGSRSYVRKGQELIITYMLETLMASSASSRST
jgi:monofunctional biosynthetic peptidoglycan transglycosylase